MATREQILRDLGGAPPVDKQQKIDDLVNPPDVITDSGMLLRRPAPELLVEQEKARDSKLDKVSRRTGDNYDPVAVSAQFDRDLGSRYARPTTASAFSPKSFTQPYEKTDWHIPLVDAAPMKPLENPTTYERIRNASLRQPLIPGEKVVQAVWNRGPDEPQIKAPETYGTIYETPTAVAMRGLQTTANAATEAYESLINRAPKSIKGVIGPGMTGFLTGAVEGADTFIKGGENVFRAADKLATDILPKPVSDVALAPARAVADAYMETGPGLQFGRSYVGASPLLLPARVLQNAGELVTEAPMKMGDAALRTILKDEVVDNIQATRQGMADTFTKGIGLGDDSIVRDVGKFIKGMSRHGVMLPSVGQEQEVAPTIYDPDLRKTPSTEESYIDRVIDRTQRDVTAGDSMMTYPEMRRLYADLYGTENAAYWGGIAAAAPVPIGPGLIGPAARLAGHPKLGGFVVNALDAGLITRGAKIHFGPAALDSTGASKLPAARVAEHTARLEDVYIAPLRRAAAESNALRQAAQAEPDITKAKALLTRANYVEQSAKLRLEDQLVKSEAETLLGLYKSSTDHADGLAKVLAAVRELKGGTVGSIYPKLMAAGDEAAIRGILLDEILPRANTPAARAVLAPLHGLTGDVFGANAMRPEIVDTAAQKLKERASSVLFASAPQDVKAVTSSVVVDRQVAKRALGEGIATSTTKLRTLEDAANPAAAKAAYDDIMRAGTERTGPSFMAKFAHTKGDAASLSTAIKASPAADQLVLADALISDALVKSGKFGARSIQSALSSDELVRAAKPSERTNIADVYRDGKARLATVVGKSPRLGDPIAFDELVAQLKANPNAAQKTSLQVLREASRIARKAKDPDYVNTAIREALVKTEQRPVDLWRMLSSKVNPDNSDEIVNLWATEYAKRNPTWAPLVNGVAQVPYPTVATVEDFARTSMQYGSRATGTAPKTIPAGRLLTDLVADGFKTKGQNVLIEEFAARNPDLAVSSRDNLWMFNNKDTFNDYLKHSLTRMIDQRTLYPHLPGPFDPNFARYMVVLADDLVRKNIRQSGVRLGDYLSTAETTGGVTQFLKADGGDALTYIFGPRSSPAGIAVREALESGKIGQTLDELLKNPEAADKITDAFSWLKTSYSQGMLAGKYAPNLGYHAVNIMTTPAVIAGTIGGEYAAKAMAKIPLTVADATRMSMGLAPSAENIVYRGVLLDERALMEMERRYNIGAANVDVVGATTYAKQAAKAVVSTMEGLPASGMRKVLDAIDGGSEGIYTRFAQETDMAFRRQIFRDALRNGETPEAAAKLARASILDYSAIPSLAQDTIGKAVVFASFQMANLQEFLVGLASGREASLQILKTLPHFSRAVDPLRLGGDDTNRFLYGYDVKEKNKRDKTAMYGPVIPQVEAMQLIGTAATLVFSMSPEAGMALLKKFSPNLPVKAIQNIFADPERRGFGQEPSMPRAAIPYLITAQLMEMEQPKLARELQHRYPDYIGTYDRTDFLGPRDAQSTYAVSPEGYPQSLRLHGAAAKGYTAFILATEAFALKRLYDDMSRAGILWQATPEMLRKWEGQGIVLSPDMRGGVLGNISNMNRARKVPTEEEAIRALQEEKIRQVRKLNK